MITIYEIAVKKIIPPLKGLLIHKLYSRGFSQRKIASVLGITQPQIHKYLSNSIDLYLDKLSEIGVDIDWINQYIDLIVDVIIKGDYSKYVLMINSIVNDILLKHICKKYSELQIYCVEGRLSDPDIEYYREWIKRIAGIDGLVRLIPEVGSNIVYSPRKPRGLYDIIGLSGRIMRAGSSIEIVGEPIYGGSRHLSKILLHAVERSMDKKIAMNIVFIDKIPYSIKKKYKIIYSGPHDSIESFWRSIDQVFENKPDIMVDRGGYGLEPITYILTNSFEELEELLRILIHKIM